MKEISPLNLICNFGGKRKGGWWCFPFGNSHVNNAIYWTVSTSIELTQKNCSVPNIMVCLIICCAVHFYFCEKYGWLFRNGEWYFFHTPPVGDSAQRIFVRLVRGYVHSKNSYLPRKVQCMKKSYMKGRKKRGLVLVGFLTQIHEILWIMDGSDFVFQLSNAILYFKPTNQKDCYYVCVCL